MKRERVGRTEKYYVYIRPGHIEYFDSIQKAQECAEYYGAEVKEV